MQIPITEIVISERQRIDVGDLAPLAQSLRAHGQAQPILVTRVDGKWHLVAGRRRLLAAQSIGWTTIEAWDRENLSLIDRQLLEFEEDVRRKDRTWQERCTAIAKIHYLKKIEGDTEWTQQRMADFCGISQASVSNMLEMARMLKLQPELFAGCASYTDAWRLLCQLQVDKATAELERRRKAQVEAGELFPPLAIERGDASPEAYQGTGVAVVDHDQPFTLDMRAALHNSKFTGIPPLVVHNDFLYGYWFLGGGNISNFYGSYSTEYLERITCLFPDAKRVLHLFSGSLPPGPYVRVGIDPTGQYKPDIEGNAEELSSFLPFKPDLIYADPPYSVEDSEHYRHAMVNRAKVISECATVLQPGGHLVWLDQALPVFSNDAIRFVGCISYIRSTGNRFRCVCLFQKPL